MVDCEPAGVLEAAFECSEGLDLLRFLCGLGEIARTYLLVECKFGLRTILSPSWLAVAYHLTRRAAVARLDQHDR